MTALLDRPVRLVVVSVGLLAVAVAVCVAIDDPTVRGVAIGAALGLVNLLVGASFTRRALAGEQGAVLVNIAAGFGARFVVLVGLMMLFTFATGLGVSPAAFGFTFLAFVFVYFGIEAVVAARLLGREAA